jgi:thiol-disulfide isomerase/thioredoxin
MLRSPSICLGSGLSLFLFLSVAIAEDAAVTKNPVPEIPISIGPDLARIPVEDLERAYAGKTPPEAVQMYLAIVKGSKMGAGEGWFGPGQSRYSWDWLAKRCGADETGIAADQFAGPRTLFERLDRNRDGRVQAEDLDWSDRNPWVQQAYLTNRLFRKLNSTGDGRLTREQWLAFFDSATNGKDSLSAADLRDHWLAGLGGSFLPGDAPSKEMLVRGLFSGEVGSLQEGPRIGDIAPDFELKSPDGERTVRLSDSFGTKPVVLVFGNYTCGPFRAMYSEVDEIARRFGDHASFFGVYVREAHPTDGWKMASNDRVGVAVPQPKTYDERTSVARQCMLRLKPTIPWLVDDVNDATGNAYSGMPARLYVIAPSGKVVYKGGRGPFGFKAGEMEQALVMTLFDAQDESATSAK